MGRLHSKPSDKKKNNTDDPEVTTRIPRKVERLKIIGDGLYDEEFIEKLKIQFHDDVETFILNQLLMCYQFFDHYERVIHKCSKFMLPEKKREIYNKLITNHEKELLLPDEVFKNVCEKVKFKGRQEQDKEIYRPLVSQRMYILHHNIDIDQKRYSRINIDYGAELINSEHNNGFVKVALVGTPRGSRYTNFTESDNSDISSNVCPDFEETNSDVPSNYNDNNNKTNDSGFNTESEYGYSTITSFKTPKEIDICETNEYTYITRLPQQCFKASETDQRNDAPLYISSVNFMEHFKSNVFPHHIGKLLDFPDSFIQQAVTDPGSIYCDAKDENDEESIIEYEILPVIQIAWPEDADEWTTRRRNTVLEQRDYGTMAIKWPTENMIKEIKNLTCVLIPKGFVPKRKRNPEQDIEWEIGFPKAERYLQLRMSHAQTRSFLFIIILFKSLIEPITGKHGLLVEHIRFHMFWECEQNYRQWPEHKLGLKILSILQNLYNQLKVQKLPHYFIKSRNILENVPSRHIMTTMEKLNDIIYSPVFHFISALKNLKYSNSAFYPEPDLDKLLEIVSSENVLEPPVESTMIANATNRNQERPKKQYGKEERSNRPEMDGRRRKGRDQTRKEINVTNKNLIMEDIAIAKRFHDDIARKVKVLIYFIQLFVDIAIQSYKISSTQQALLYLKQAGYLTKMLKEHDHDSAEEFQKKITEQEEICEKKKAHEPEKPETPKRNTFVGRNILEVKGNEIDMLNLTKSYNDAVLAKPPDPYIKKKKKKQISFNSVSQSVSADIHNPINSTLNKSLDNKTFLNSVPMSGTEKSVSSVLKKEQTVTDTNSYDEIEVTSL